MTTPFQATVNISLAPGHGGENGWVNVPAGKRLVIEFVSGEAFMPTGQKALFGIVVQNASGTVRHYLGTHAVGSFGGQDYFWVSTPAKFYADAATKVDLRADRDLTTGTATFRLSLSGYLEGFCTGVSGVEWAAPPASGKKPANIFRISRRHWPSAWRNCSGVSNPHRTATR